jgi:hypothetical protein
MPFFSGHTHRHRAPSGFTLTENGAGTADQTRTADQKRHVPSHDEIACLAYSYWQARQGKEGSAFEDWLRAEQELTIGRHRSG